jgi:hypothetical protein
MNYPNGMMVKVGHGLEIVPLPCGRGRVEEYPIFQDYEDVLECPENGVRYSPWANCWTYDPDGPPGLLCDCAPPDPSLDQEA